MNITLPQNPKLRLAINLLTYAVMGWYLLCDLLSLLLRLKFVPYHPTVYGICLTLLTVLACCAQACYPADNDYNSHLPSCNLDRRIPALVLPVAVVFYFSDFYTVSSILLTVVLVSIATAAALWMRHVCLEDGYQKGLTLIFFFAAVAFCLLILGQTLLVPSSEKVLLSERSYGPNGRVVVVTQTRKFGQRVQTQVDVRDCTPFSLGVGRFEKTYNNGSTAWSEPLDSVTPADIAWDGNVLYVNNEPFFTAS